jgi:hypothetical protein
MELLPNGRRGEPPDGPVKRSYEPLQVNRSYEPPRVMRLHHAGQAAGACGPGSSAVDACTANGASATGDCDATGGSASQICLSQGGSAFSCELGDAAS